MRASAIVVFVLVLSPEILGQVVGWVDMNQQIVLEPIAGKPVALPGVELTSESGLLTPAERAAPPFTLLLSNTPEQVTFGSLHTVSIEEQTALGVGYDLAAALEQGNDPCNDIQLASGAAIRPFCATPGDADFSGTVDFADFLIVSEHFGNSETAWTSGDFDWDRRTGFSDFLILSEHFGDTYPKFVVTDAEPVVVRTSTQAESDFRSGDFISDPIVSFGAPDYWVDKEQLWASWPEEVVASDPLVENDPITIVAPSVDYSRATHFGVEWTIADDRLEIFSVRTRRANQTADFKIPEDFGKALALPIGPLEAGEYVVDVTSYEIVDATAWGEDVDFDVSGFLADPDNFEMPDGLQWGSATATSLGFHIGAETMNPVPEPRFNSQFLAVMFGIVLTTRGRFGRSPAFGNR